MLRDRNVCGIRDDDARRSLLTRATLTLKEAEDFARASEKAQEDVSDMQETGVGNGSGTMNALLRLRRRESRAPSSNLESSRPLCERCDGPHYSNVCRHRNTKCRMCGRKGHLGRVCRRSRSRTSGAYVVEEDESESEEFTLALVAHSATDRDVSRPLEKVLTWGGQELSMIIDTGSPDSGLKLNKTKCRFREKQVTFLGHRIDEKGLHPLQDNLGAILGAPSPTSCMPLPAAQVPSSWPETDKRWSRLHVDFAGSVEGHMILVLVDAVVEDPLRQNDVPEKELDTGGQLLVKLRAISGDQNGQPTQ
ncbi:uncharacterized protein LOC119397342 [Rhipicephalus sanguineus]|uniref:uncharacterized protein LOC119397342 n=1 Tax=Rhipicephalus sanguineus TaxID=34632 RepID=UPI0018948EA4|nr:uncharacterized protein LOC119397342 [Rhipicephalus sanguineus]